MRTAVPKKLGIHLVIFFMRAPVATPAIAPKSKNPSLDVTVDASEPSYDGLCGVSGRHLLGDDVASADKQQEEGQRRPHDHVGSGARAASATQRRRDTFRDCKFASFIVLFQKSQLFHNGATDAKQRPLPHQELHGAGRAAVFVDVRRRSRDDGDFFDERGVGYMYM